jgi:hypothetical protein
MKRNSSAHSPAEGPAGGRSGCIRTADQMNNRGKKRRRASRYRNLGGPPGQAPSVVQVAKGGALRTRGPVAQSWEEQQWKASPWGLPLRVLPPVGEGLRGCWSPVAWHRSSGSWSGGGGELFQPLDGWGGRGWPPDRPPGCPGGALLRALSLPSVPAAPKGNSLMVRFLGSARELQCQSFLQKSVT